MKIIRRATFVAMLAVASFCFISCNNEDSACGCSKDTVNMIKMNRVEYENLNRSQWLALPDSIKRAVYSVMTPHAKYEFWNDKMNELKHLQLSSSELAHVTVFADFIQQNEQIFNTHYLADTANIRVLENFVRTWREYATHTLNWNKSIQYCMIAYGGTLTNEMFRYLKDGGSITDGYIDSYCKCNQKNDWCLGGKKCQKCTCISDTDGCGSLWIYPCDGGCFK